MKKKTELLWLGFNYQCFNGEGGNGAFTVTASGSHNSAKVTSLHRLGVPLYLTESKGTFYS